MTINKFVLYTFPFRSRADRVLWALKEFNFPYEVVSLDPLKGETCTKEFLSLNPSGKMPVLIHNGVALTESLAIIEFLNDLSENIKLIPTEPKAAFNYRKVVHYGLTEIEPYLWIAEQTTRLKLLYSWPDGTYESAMSQVRTNLKPVWLWLEANKYIAGNEFTLADIYYYQLIMWSKQHKISWRPDIIEYAKRLEARKDFPIEILQK